MKTLKKRMIILYSITTMIIVILLSLVFNMLINTIFRKYAEGIHNKYVNQMIENIENQYEINTGTFDQNNIEVIGLTSLKKGFLLRIVSADGRFYWSIRTKNDYDCIEILRATDEHMHMVYPNFKGEFVENRYEIMDEQGRLIGWVYVGYYGPYFLSSNEAMLVWNLNHAIIFIGLIFLLFSILIAIIISNRYSNPITSVTQIAKRIANGEYGVQSNQRTRTKELDDLIRSINEMSFALEKDEIQKRQMCTDIAHELRTPLCNLQGNVEAMMDGLWEPTKYRLERCHTEILRLASLVNQLQELYLLENTAETIYMSEFNFYDLCCRVQDEFETRTNEKNIRIRLQVPEDAVIYGDVQKIKQCMFNLVANAITYSEQGDEIEISYELVTTKEAVIKVRDYGEGISKEELESIFERFYRTDKSRNSKTGGMGIGLSITKAIIERHNGTITVYSEFGKGTTFEIHLPAFDP
jgi:two-component system, OmpR family, sensor histidine kinase BaeS